MYPSIDNLKSLRQKSFDEKGEKKATEFGEYLESLNKIIESLYDYSKSEDSKDWEAGINISDNIISYFNSLSEINNYNKESWLGKWLSRYDKWRKRKIKMNDDRERYKILSLVINSILLKIKLEVIKDGKVIPHTYIVNEVEHPKEIKKIIQNYIHEMLWEIRCSRIGNKLFVYNTLLDCFMEWQEGFKNNQGIVDYLHFRQLWATMKIKKYLGTYYLKRNIIIDGLINKISWVIRLLFWLVSGFGEKTLRYIFWVFSVIIFFGIFYSYSGYIKISSCGNILNRFGDGLYFSVITITTLGYGDIYPYHDWGKTVSSIEVALGYVLLAVLTHLVIKKLRI